MHDVLGLLRGKNELRGRCDGPLELYITLSSPLQQKGACAAESEISAMQDSIRAAAMPFLAQGPNATDSRTFQVQG